MGIAIRFLAVTGFVWLSLFSGFAKQAHAQLVLVSGQKILDKTIGMSFLAPDDRALATYLFLKFPTISHGTKLRVIAGQSFKDLLLKQAEAARPSTIAYRRLKVALANAGVPAGMSPAEMALFDRDALHPLFIPLDRSRFAKEIPNGEFIAGDLEAAGVYFIIDFIKYRARERSLPVQNRYRAFEFLNERSVNEVAAVLDRYISRTSYVGLDQLRLSDEVRAAIKENNLPNYMTDEELKGSLLSTPALFEIWLSWEVSNGANIYEVQMSCERLLSDLAGRKELK